MLDNNSKIPGRQTYRKDSKLSSLQFVDKDITKITRSLNTNKAHGNDYISIRMLKICTLIRDLAIIKPLSIIFRNCINHSKFPDLWKKSNICLILKKGDKQIINNYRPVSLLPICGKILERLLFNSLFEHLEKYKLLSAHQSGFQANDSCVDQLLSTVHNIYTALVYTHAQLLNLVECFWMSRIFDKVWNEGLIFILKSIGISDALLDFTGSFLENRFQ